MVPHSQLPAPPHITVTQRVGWWMYVAAQGVKHHSEVWDNSGCHSQWVHGLARFSELLPCKNTHRKSQQFIDRVNWRCAGDDISAKYKSIFDDGSGEMKVHRGKVHKYLGMSLDFTNKGQCIVTMNDYLADIVKAYDLAIAKHDMGFYLSLSSVTRHLLQRICLRLMRTVRSCQSRWQQISTPSPSLQRCCMWLKGQGLIHACLYFPMARDRLHQPQPWIFRHTNKWVILLAPIWYPHGPVL